MEQVEFLINSDQVNLLCNHSLLKNWWPGETLPMTKFYCTTIKATTFLVIYPDDPRFININYMYNGGWVFTYGIQSWISGSKWMDEWIIHLVFFFLPLCRFLCHRIWHFYIILKNYEFWNLRCQCMFFWQKNFLIVIVCFVRSFALIQPQRHPEGSPRLPHTYYQKGMSLLLGNVKRLHRPLDFYLNSIHFDTFKV